ncbi:MAG: shikimate dehydrogenase [Sedimentisphaeraceae bacterium JB056]
MSYLTIPISETTEEKFIASIKKAAEKKPDIIELRTDCLHNLNYDTLETLIKTSKALSVPVIVTCRDPKEGGMHDHSQLVRLEILCEAIRLGADYIDCEYLNYQNMKIQELIGKAMDQNPACRLILSTHNFDEPFYDIEALYQNMHDLNRSAIIKMAYKVNHISDCIAAFNLLRHRKGDLIIACMGNGGEISRILASKTHNFITFAALDKESGSAPGQLTVDQMRDMYRFDAISSNTELYGIIANPVGHSASPAIYNGSFTHADIDALYLPLLVEGDKEGFDKFLNAVGANPWLKFRGFSVTIPHKNSAFDYVKKYGTIDEKALPIGAINTISISETGQVTGYNTDYAGAMNPLKRSVGNISGKKAAVIGAGGVSKAIVAGLVDNQADVTIFNRTVEKAKVLADIFDCSYDSIDNINRLSEESFEIVINCTSIGMSPNIDSSPVEEEHLNENMTVFDTVYNPLETKLLKYAKSAGANTINGLEMFIEQAIEQYKLLTGEDAQKQVIEQVLREKLQAK